MPKRMQVNVFTGTDRLLHELADWLDVYAPAQWSPSFLRAVIALFDLEESRQGPPAPVLQL